MEVGESSLDRFLSQFLALKVHWLLNESNENNCTSLPITVIEMHSSYGVIKR